MAGTVKCGAHREQCLWKLAPLPAVPGQPLGFTGGIQWVEVQQAGLYRISYGVSAAPENPQPAAIVLLIGQKPVEESRCWLKQPERCCSGEMFLWLNQEEKIGLFPETEQPAFLSSAYLTVLQL